MIMYSIFIGLNILFVCLLINSELRHEQRKIYIFKPIATALVIFIASFSFFVPPNFNASFSLLICLGLVFSYGGDIALMFKTKKAFRLGLILFLIAHVVYAVAFTVFAASYHWKPTSSLLILVLAIVIYSYLYSGLNNLKIPVFIYVMVISFMVDRAIATFSGDFFSQTQAILITIGAGLFYLSDLILAVNKFKKPLKYHRISLVFYYSGQVLIALSTAFFEI